MIPEDRDYTAVDSGPIRPETFNRLQDSIKFGWHGYAKFNVAPSPGGGGSGSSGPGEVGLNATPHYEPLQLPEGATISEISVDHERSSGTLTFDLVVWNAGATAITNLASISSGTSWTNTVLPLSPGVELAAGDRVSLRATGGSGNLGGYTVTFKSD